MQLPREQQLTDYANVEKLVRFLTCRWRQVATNELSSASLVGHFGGRKVRSWEIEKRSP